MVCSILPLSHGNKVSAGNDIQAMQHPCISHFHNFHHPEMVNIYSQIKKELKYSITDNKVFDASSSDLQYLQGFLNALELLQKPKYFKLT
jgi:hypothetical protein